MPATKPTRLNVRIREADNEVIREAAAVAGESVTDFVTESAVERAHTILADRRRFVLDGPSWGLFVAGFSREPKVIPAIQKLFREPSLLDEE